MNHPSNALSCWQFRMCVLASMLTYVPKMTIQAQSPAHGRLASLNSDGTSLYVGRPRTDRYCVPKLRYRLPVHEQVLAGSEALDNIVA